MLSKMDAGRGAGRAAGSASDAFGGDGDFFRLQIQRTGPSAGHAGDAFFLFPAYLHQAETVEPSVDSAQRAEILAERAVYFDG